MVACTFSDIFVVGCEREGEEADWWKRSSQKIRMQCAVVEIARVNGLPPLKQSQSNAGGVAGIKLAWCWFNAQKQWQSWWFLVTRVAQIKYAHATVGLNDPSVVRLITKFRGSAVTNCRFCSKCVTEVDVNGNGSSPLEVRC